MSDAASWGTGAPRHQFWVNLSTGEIEEGRLSPAGHRMGPYRTREEAELAFDQAAHRTAAWDEDDKRWRKAWEDEEPDDQWPGAADSGPVP